MERSSGSDEHLLSPRFPWLLLEDAEARRYGHRRRGKRCKTMSSSVRLELFRPWETCWAKGDRGLPWESGGFAPHSHAQAWL